MKIRVITLLFLLVCGCGPSYNVSLLDPDEIPLNQKIDLKLQDSYENTFVGITPNLKRDLGELLIDEVNTNFISEEFPKGYLVPTLDCSMKTTGFGFSFFTGFFLGTLNILGMPVGGRDIEMRLKFVVEDNENNVIWKKSYQETKKSYYGFYYGWGSAKDNASLRLLKKLLVNFKQDMQKDYDSIIKKLDESRPIDPRKYPRQNKRIQKIN